MCKFEILYFGQTLVDITFHFSVSAVWRFSAVDGSVEESDENAIGRFNLSFRWMTEDCHPSERTEEMLPVMENVIFVGRWL